MDKPSLTVVDSTTDSPLKALQEHYALSSIGGEIRILNRFNITRVLDGDPEASVEFIKKADGFVMMKRFLERQPIPLSAKGMSLVINEWLFHPDTKEFDSISFTPIKTEPHVLNLWVGPTVIPEPGEYETIEEYLFEIIADSDSDLFKYICFYIAHALQHPEEKPGIMIVLIGDEGVGKGFFFMLLARIWGCTTIEVSDMSKVVGVFNKDIENNLFFRIQSII